ncbi:MAG TPA: hypothetical protein VK066_30065 [Chloroflexota bacterium]|nr:hypothetical protein [Chloroflexota bacterium]
MSAEHAEGAPSGVPRQGALLSTQRSALGARLRGWLGALRELFYGMTGYEFAQHARQLRAERETLLLALVFGDMLGLPVLPPYYSLRLLPYAVPELERWKRRVLRERHPLDNEEFDLIEM